MNHILGNIFHFGVIPILMKKCHILLTKIMALSQSKNFKVLISIRSPNEWGKCKWKHKILYYKITITYQWKVLPYDSLSYQDKKILRI